MFKPQLITCLRTYSWEQFRADAISGLIVGVVALPLAIAFAIASGVTPDRGFVTAIVAGFLISVLGGSKVQIGGPTGAFVVIVYGIVQKFGVDGLILATLMGGFLLFLAGVFKFGAVIQFIPYPVTVGFTAGIAVIIFSSQVKDFLGLSMGTVPADFIEKWVEYAKHITSVNPYSLGLAGMTVVIMLGWQKVVRRVPGSLVAIVGLSALAYFLHFPVETIFSRFGEIPHSLPTPHWPVFSWSMVRELMPAAISISILAGLESLLSAMVADGMIGDKHRPNTELVAQGVANMASALFGGMPATGAIARTATNVQNGGRTPVAGVVHALTLLIIMYFFTQFAGHIPLACLAGVLAVVAWRMAEYHAILRILKCPKSDVLVMAATFFLTVVFDLTVAIQAGLALSFFLFIQNLSRVTNLNVITSEMSDEQKKGHALKEIQVPEGVEVFEIRGPLFFGVASTFLDTVQAIKKIPKVRILRMRHVLSLDATALEAIKQVHSESRKKGIRFLIADLHSQPLVAMQESGLWDEIGEENVPGTLKETIEKARALLLSASAEKN